MPTTPPGVPELTSVGAGSPGTLVVSWINNTNNETGFDLQRRRGSNGTWASIAMAPRGGTAYVDRGLTAGQRYDYRIRAVNEAGKSAWSNTLSGTPISAPPPPPTPPPPTGAVRYAAPAAGGSGDGSLARPWNIVTALDGRVRPSETLLLRGGTYPTWSFDDLGAEVRLAGTPSAPIHIKPYPGERVIIDGGLRFVAPSQHVWLWDVEVLVSEPRALKEEATTGDPRRQWGGVNVDSGEGCKLINLVVHDNCQGISAWKGATDLEVYGCLVYDNGWEFVDGNGKDNSTGYAIYAQNEGPGWKTIRDCLLLDTLSWTLHLYGEDASVDNFLIEGNVVAFLEPDRDDLALVGGLEPSRNIRVIGNWWRNSETWIGYQGSESNVNCEVRDNLSVGGYFRINPNWQRVEQSGNVVVEEASQAGTRVMLRLNKYDANRANLAIVNGRRQSSVDVDAGALIRAGERWRLMDPRNMWGAPVWEGSGPNISVPMGGAEFGVFVLRRDL